MDKTSKVQNRRMVLDAFRRAMCMSSTEVAEVAGQSRSTAHRAVEYLRRKNLLLVSGKGQSSDNGGKKPLLLSLNATYKYVLCFHIQVGGLTAGITDLAGRVHAENSVFFPFNSPLDLVLSHMRAAYESMSAGLRLKERDFAGVAVGCNGVADTVNGILAGSPNFASWGRDIPLRSLVETMFRTPPPVYIDNANRFGAYAEYRAGQARGARDFIVFDAHLDGLGAGIVLGGGMWRGNHCLAGEIGHLTVDPRSTRSCTCGARGCLEVMVSMTVLEENARAGYARNKRSLVFTRTPPAEVTYKGVYNAANAGDDFACGLVRQQAHWLAMGANAAALILDPELIILQGSLTKGGDFLLQVLGEEMAGLGLPRVLRKPEICYSNLGHERCLTGQSHYIADIFFSDSALYE